MLPLKALVQGKLKGHRKIQTPAETSRDKIKDRKSTRLNSSHGYISYAVFCLKKKKLQSGGGARVLPRAHLAAVRLEQRPGFAERLAARSDHLRGQLCARDRAVAVVRSRRRS